MFDGVDQHPMLIDGAAALGFGLVANHSFVDGNSRIGHAGMDMSLGGMRNLKGCTAAGDSDYTLGADGSGERHSCRSV
jgi:Fic/DOC family protein